MMALILCTPLRRPLKQNLITSHFAVKVATQQSTLAIAIKEN